jgi:hypothetical protein
MSSGELKREEAAEADRVRFTGGRFEVPTFIEPVLDEADAPPISTLSTLAALNRATSLSATECHLTSKSSNPALLSALATSIRWYFGDRRCIKSVNVRQRVSLLKV